MSININISFKLPFNTLPIFILLFLIALKNNNMVHNIKLKTGVKNGKPISINDSLEKDYFQNCFCPDPNCNSPLIAKMGNIRTNHFAHKSGSSKCYGLETSLHLKAKEIIEKLDKLEVPNYTLSLDMIYTFLYEDIFPLERKYDFEIFNNILTLNTFEFNSLSNYFNIINGRLGFEDIKILTTSIINLNSFIVQLEKSEGSFIPDITLTNKKTLEKIFIEIGVTHLIDESKRKIISDNDLTVLEVDFSKYYKLYNTPEEDLELYLTNPIEFKKNNPSKYYSIYKKWFNISKIGRYIKKDKKRILFEFELCLKKLSNYYNNEIRDLFKTQLKSYNKIDHKDFLKEFIPPWEDKNILELLKCDIIFCFFKNKYLKSEAAQVIIKKQKQREQDRINLHFRLRNY